MINVLALTEGKNTPSSRFRVRQYINILHDYDIKVVEKSGIIEKYEKIPFIKQKFKTRYILPIYIFHELIKVLFSIPRLLLANFSDIIWLQRDLVSGIKTLEFFFTKKYIFDIDDAVWLSKPFGRYTTKLICKKATLIFAGNSFLKEYCSKYNGNIVVIPTAIDIEKFQPKDIHLHENNDFIIGWTGSGINLKYLYQIEKELALFINSHKVKLHILSDIKPDFKYIQTSKIEFIPWSIENEVTVIQDWSVGIMPLPDDEFSKGKCSFKMLQYMAVGLPVIVSNIGMNKELLELDMIGLGINSNEEWPTALSDLYNSDDKRYLMGQNGRKIVETKYSTKVVAEKIAREIKFLYK